MAISIHTVMEARTAGSATNGGGFVSGATGTDYSQQNSANSGGSNSSTVDAVANGTTTLTSATAAFTSAITGNIIYLAGGSGSLTGGWYQATYSNATTITLDRSVAAGTGITMNIGGAVLLANAFSMVPANSNVQIYVKNDGIHSTSTGFSSANGSGSTDRGVAPPCRVIGYTTTRGDGTTPGNEARLQITSGNSGVTLIAVSTVQG
jgi:hypothetical protein